jgi:hypothetical protein
MPTRVEHSIMRYPVNNPQRHTEKGERNREFHFRAGHFARPII